MTINQIHNVYEVPPGLQQMWYARGYHGSPEHNARGVIQRFIGFWDCKMCIQDLAQTGELSAIRPPSPSDVEAANGCFPPQADGRFVANQVPAAHGDNSAHPCGNLLGTDSDQH